MNLFILFQHQNNRPDEILFADCSHDLVKELEEKLKRESDKKGLYIKAPTLKFDGDFVKQVITESQHKQSISELSKEDRESVLEMLKDGLKIEEALDNVWSLNRKDGTS